MVLGGAGFFDEYGWAVFPCLKSWDFGAILMLRRKRWEVDGQWALESVSLRHSLTVLYEVTWAGKLSKFDLLSQVGGWGRLRNVRMAVWL